VIPRRHGERDILRLASCTPSAHEVDDQAYHQDKAERAATDHWAAKVKAAAAEQENKEKNK
jgi:hypothetical protein